MTKEDLVNHPGHYTKGIETTDYIISHGMSYCEGNVIKYITRWRQKGGVQDLEKARWYLNKLISEATKTNGQGGVQ